MCVLQVNEIFLNSNLIENVIVVLKKMKVWKKSQFCQEQLPTPLAQVS